MRPERFSTFSALLAACVAALFTDLAFAAPAQFDDPLKSEACAQSLAVWQQARTSPGPEAERLRQRATRDCLGGPAPVQAPARSAQPAAALNGSNPAPPQPQEQVVPVTAPPTQAPLAIERPSMAMQCDAAGCWDDRGQRLDRRGDHLQGPRGPCLPQGNGFVCP